MAKSVPRGSTPAAPGDAHEGARIGRYRVVSRLGRGGMGMVYRGLDEALEREVAVKTLTAEGTFDDENRKRFEIEAKSAARLQHPNIVTVYELGEDRGVPFIAMELLPGADLEALLKSGEALTLEEQLDIVIQVCRGLAFAHEHKVVHRDIKPSNIRLLDDGAAKIMDFGIAKLGSTNVTKVGMMVGTLNYMSPEQIRGLPLDGRCDVFAVGVILYQMLTGRRPFVGKGGPDVLYKIVQEQTPPLGVDLGPETERLQAIINKALEKDPQLRYESAGHMADELQRILHARQRGPALAPPDQELLTGARRALKEGRLQEAQQKLQPVLARQPSSPEARRLMRALRREQHARENPSEPKSGEFPELEATYRAHITARSPTTAVAAPAVPPAQPASRWTAPAAGALLLVAAVVAGVLLRRGPRPTEAPAEPPVVSQPPAHEASQRPPPEPKLLKLAVKTEPAGAVLSLDGVKAGTTPAELEIDPAKDHKLTVALEGYASQEIRLPAGGVPSPLALALERVPPGALTVVSSYPVDVLWKGKLLAKGQVSPRVSLPPGRQSVTVVSASNFLRREAAVDVKAGGTIGLEMPGLGKINIKANPDNCKVFIDGVFADYPPILDAAIVEGSHSVSFEWPDGVKRDETVQVAKGAASYVMGRRE